MRSQKIISIDSVVAEMFFRKYPQKASRMIEQFMRSDLDIQIEKDSELELQLEIEKQDKLLAEHRLLMAHLKEKHRSVVDKKIKDIALIAKKNAELQQIENDSLISIKDFDWEFEWNYLSKKNPKLLASRYIEIKQSNPDMKASELLSLLME